LIDPLPDPSGRARGAPPTVTDGDGLVVADPADRLAALLSGASALPG
jgi:hypothetical protein